MLSVFLLVIFLCTAVNAQSYMSDDYTSEDIEQIRYNITDLLKDNIKLEAQYELLSREMYGLEIRYTQVKGELGKIRQQAMDDKEQRQMNRGALEALSGDIGQLKNEILIKKSRLSFLKGQLIDSDKLLVLWKLRQSDAEYYVRQLELEKKKQAIDKDEMKEKRAESIRKLKGEVLRLEREKKELAESISEIKELRFLDPQSFNDLLLDNQELQARIDKFKTEHMIKQKEVSILKDKKNLAELRNDNENSQFYEEEEALSRGIKKLEDEYSKMEERVDLSLMQKNRKRQIMKGIINLDKQNQGLLSEVSKLQEGLNEDQ